MHRDFQSQEWFSGAFFRLFLWCQPNQTLERKSPTHQVIQNLFQLLSVAQTSLK